ncbi:aspartate/glutamate racemase family protein [Hoeflea sp. TYP-13]|uniref:aspartate/glutamate racemase family protein n=1 Tax=Hoeflea sp. TYP-13 TaxID=3230023 RepID=UPI0034C6D494
MRILIVNPNTTSSMTGKIAEVARSVARPDTQIIAVNPDQGPSSIEGFYDIALSLPGLLSEVGRHRDIDAVVIACFDDTGLDAVRCAVDVPVIGIGEAAYHAASFLACKFSVITTLVRSVPGLEANLQRYGLASRCARVRATDIPVLELERNDPDTVGRISLEIQKAIEEDHAEAIVLGCAGMADLMQRLSHEHGLPVVDGVTCAITFAEALIASRLKTSKIGAYAMHKQAAERENLPI